LLDSTEVLLKLEKKHLISINGKKKFKIILVVQGEKFKLRKLPSREFTFVFFTAENQKLLEKALR